MSEYESEIINAINEVVFEKDELAYLSATTKIELPYRDKLAWKLQKKIRSSKVLCLREWKRTDIAIIKNNSAHSLIELKAMYTFDCLNKNIEKYIEYLNNDQEKMSRLVGDAASKYIILLAAHPCNAIPEEYIPYVKYSKGVNSAINRIGSAEIVLKESNKTVLETMENKSRKIIFKKIYQGGTAFGTQISICLWLMSCTKNAIQEN